MAILLFLDVNTLFLAALFLSVLAFKSTKQDLDKIIGIFFALSVSPAHSIEMGKILVFSNGFLIQSLVSFLFFLFFYHYKPSIIGRLYKNSKGNMGITLSGILCGFSAGIVSSLLWQAYLNLI
jgi:phosphatidylglycerophosphatase A